MSTAIRNRTRPRHPAHRRRPAPLVVAAVAAMAVAALLTMAIAAAGGGGGDGRGDSATSTAAAFDTGTARAEGTALAPRPDGGTDPAVGRAAPTVAGTGRDGDPVVLPAAGRPTLVVFLAHWCPHCQREVPRLQGWIDGGRLPVGVDVVAVATAIDPTRPNHPTSAWLDREGWTPPTVADADGRAAAAYGVDAFPYFVAVDAGGTVVERRSGELSLDQVAAMVDGAGGTGPR